MKTFFATALCIVFASADGGGYGGKGGKGDCRDVKQEKPICKKHTRHVKEKFTVHDYKQKCHFEKKTRHESVHVKVSKDVCKPHIEKVKNKHIVHINNKVCEEDHRNDGYGKQNKKPHCKIVKETKYIDGYDKVTKYSCHPEHDKKKVDVTLHYKKEVCKEYPEKHDEYVTLEVTETKCHVEKYTRRVCDDGPFDDVKYHSKGGHGGDNKGGGYGDHSKGGGYGDHSKGGGYGDHSKGGGYGDHSKGGGYGDHSKGYGYGDHSKGGGYGDHSKGGGYGDHSKGGDYGDHSKGGGYGDHSKGGGYGDNN